MCTYLILVSRLESLGFVFCLESEGGLPLPICQTSSGGSGPVLIRGARVGPAFFVTGTYNPEKKDKSLIQTKSLQEICQCVIDADSLLGGHTGVKTQSYGALAPVAPPPPTRNAPADKI